MPSSPILLEVCVDSPGGFDAAVSGGADRIELCSSLAVGGLTPSVGLMAHAARSSCPARAMIRPRVGAFIFDQAEIDIIRRDIDAARVAGLAGVVIGANRPSGELDQAALRQMVDQAGDMEIALHRAIDLTPDPFAALDLAIEFGFDTVLTSGTSLNAIEGAAVIARLHQRAAGRIEILAGGGVRPTNVAQLVAATGVRAVHGSCSSAGHDADPRLVAFGFITDGARETDRAQVAAMKEALRGLT